MREEIEAGIRRGRQEIEVARSLADAGFPAQAVSRAYYGCFYLAEMALLALGETRSKHSGVLSAFVQLLVKEKGLDPELGMILRARFEDRNEADYEFGEPSAKDATDAIEEANRFVAAVSEWLEAAARADAT